MIPDKFWRESIEEVIERSKAHHCRYDQILVVDNIVALGSVIPWEQVYNLVLENMDEVEASAKMHTYHPTGMDQHYKELEYKKILDECVCARCHEPLTAHHLEWGEWEIFCLDCGYDCGLVSQYHAKKIKHYDATWALEADRRLSGLMEFRNEEGE